MIFNRWFEQFDQQFRLPGVTFLYFDFFALDCYRKLFVNKECPIKIGHEISDKKSYLFLLGKPDRIHRINLLYELVKRGILDKQTNYSFQVNSPGVKEDCFVQLGIKRPEFEDFVAQYQKSLDIEFEYVNDGRHIHYTGIPFNQEIYNRSNFQVIAETNCANTRPWITEKTWLPIINHMPFVLIGDRYICQHLEDRGFKTFREYMPHPEYDSRGSSQERVNLAIENIKYFSENISKHREDILRDVNSNFNLYHDLVKQNLDLARQVLREHKIDLSPIDLFIGYDNHYPHQHKEKL